MVFRIGYFLFTIFMFNVSIVFVSNAVYTTETPKRRYTVKTIHSLTSQDIFLCEIGNKCRALSSVSSRTIKALIGKVKNAQSPVACFIAVADFMANYEVRSSIFGIDDKKYAYCDTVISSCTKYDQKDGYY